MTQNNTNRLMATALGFGLVGATANAAVLTEQENFGGTPNISPVLNFNKFNPALGTLDSVQVSVQLTMTDGLLQVDNDGGGVANITTELGGTANISSVDVNLLDATFQPVVAQIKASQTQAFGLLADDGDGAGFQTGGGDHDSFGPINESASAAGTINPAFHGQFTGAGETFDITAAINNVIDFGSVGGVEGSFSPLTAAGNVTVVYNYTPVPEPHEYAMVAGLGLVGFALARRRFMNRASAEEVAA